MRCDKNVDERNMIREISFVRMLSRLLGLWKNRTAGPFEVSFSFIVLAR